MLIHGMLEAFVRERPARSVDSAAEQRLLAIGREAFARTIAIFPK